MHFYQKFTSSEEICVCGSELDQVDFVSYLGVTLTNNFKWSQHVSSISGKASKVLGVIIKRNFWNCPWSVKETAYTTLVRPKLEYGCEAWDPHFKKDISSLERGQRKAARFCSNNYQPTDSVTGMLRDLGWFSPETRRTIARLNLMYKICHCTVDIDKIVTGARITTAESKLVLVMIMNF